MKQPHLPTLGVTVVIVVLAILIYHVALRKK
jgi:Na+-transporting methylmalonyl-CoA/oxaloacetate decarboxylase gamma subunit